MTNRDRDGEPINKRRGKPLVEILAPRKRLVKAVSVNPVTFYDPQQQRQVVILYALDEDGVIREYVNNVWKPYPIEAE